MAEAAEPPPQIVNTDKETTAVVSVVIETQPKGATIFQDGRKIGETPQSVQFDPADTSPKVFTLKKLGFQPKSVAISPADGPEKLVLLKPGRATKKVAKRSESKKGTVLALALGYPPSDPLDKLGI